jgi:hypothetical protein
VSKKAYYFSHDSNARGDEKLLELRCDMGWEGYGLYWAIIEMLRDATKYQLECNYKRIAFGLNTEPEKVQKVVESFKLFQIKDGSFFSVSLRQRMKKADEISKSASKAAKSRWNKEMRTHSERTTDAKQTHSERNANKRKEIKETKEIKYNPRRAADGLDWIEQALWQEWIDHKRKVKASVSERAIDMNLKELEKFGKGVANAVLAQSLDRGWKGLFALNAAQAQPGSALANPDRQRIAKQLDYLAVLIIEDAENAKRYPDSPELIKIKDNTEPLALIDEAKGAGVALPVTVKEWANNKGGTK